MNKQNVKDVVDVNVTFPYTEDTIRHICIWYSEDGLRGMANNREKCKPCDASIWVGVSLGEIEQIVNECKADGRYIKYVTEYQQYQATKSTCDRPQALNLGLDVDNAASLYVRKIYHLYNAMAFS